jgi:hypothetical protein
LQGVIGHIKAALNADFLDRIGYVHGVMDRKPGCVFNGAWRFTSGQRDISSGRKFLRAPFSDQFDRRRSRKMGK